MTSWSAWLWVVPVCFSVVGCAVGFWHGDHVLIGKSLLVLAGALSLARVGAVVTFPL